MRAASCSLVQWELSLYDPHSLFMTSTLLLSGEAAIYLIYLSIYKWMPNINVMYRIRICA